MKLIKVKEQGVEHTPQKIIIYGAPKSGKTEATGKIAKYFDKTIWFDLEKGYTTLLKLPDEDLEKIELVRVKDTSKDTVAVQTLMKAFEGPVEICDKHGRIITICSECRSKKLETIKLDLPNEDNSTLVVVDSLTQLSKSAIHHATNKSNVDLASLDIEGKATFNHWGMQGRYLDKILTDMQQLNCHVVFISHEQNLKMDDKQELLSPVGGTSNYSRKIGGAFDHVVRLYMKNNKHVGISDTTGNAIMTAGSRLDSNVMKDGKVDLYECFKIGEKKVAKQLTARTVGIGVGGNKNAASIKKEEASKEKKVEETVKPKLSIKIN